MIILALIVGGGCAPQTYRSGPAGADPNSLCVQGLQALRAGALALSFDDDAGHHLCVPQSTNCSDDCIVDLGDVAVGASKRVDLVVTVGNRATVSVDVESISFSATARDDWYVDGEPPSIFAANAPTTFSVVLRPTGVGDCGAVLDVVTDAANGDTTFERGAGNTPLTLRASCTDDDGAPEQCNIDGACCCASGAPSGDASCDVDTGRVACANGFLAFDDACTESPCAP